MSRYRKAIADARERVVSEALVENDGNVAAAARALGLDRPSMYKIMRAIEIERAPRPHANRGNKHWQELSA